MENARDLEDFSGLGIMTLMRSTNRNIRGKLALVSRIVAALLLFFPMAGGARLQPGSQNQGDQAAFTDSVASGLLSLIANGLESRNHNKVLGAFELTAMQDGQLFKQQMVSFMDHAETIRIHMNLLQTSVEGSKGTAEVDAEMEADPRASEGVPVHKQARLVFTAENTQAGWKFTDVQPRSFFSLQP